MFLKNESFKNNEKNPLFWFQMRNAMIIGDEKNEKIKVRTV